MVTRRELTRMGRMGFSDEDYAKWLKRGIARREDIQAHEVTLRKMIETGATGRKGMEEAGLVKRQKAKFVFEEPGERAETRETVARAAREEYGLGFEKEVRPTLKTLVKQKGELGALDIDVLKKELAGPEAIPAKKEVARPAAAPGVAKPKRKLRPSIKRFMWEGTPTRTGLRLPGLLAPAYGYKNIADWLGHFAKKGLEYAYPRSR